MWWPSRERTGRQAVCTRSAAPAASEQSCAPLSTRCFARGRAVRSPAGGSWYRAGSAALRFGRPHGAAGFGNDAVQCMAPRPDWLPCCCGHSAAACSADLQLHAYSFPVCSADTHFPAFSLPEANMELHKLKQERAPDSRS